MDKRYEPKIYEENNNVIEKRIWVKPEYRGYVCLSWYDDLGQNQCEADVINNCLTACVCEC